MKLSIAEILLLVLGIQVVNSCVTYAILVHGERHGKQIIEACGTKPKATPSINIKYSELPSKVPNNNSFCIGWNC
jgi:hypothetical protein